MNFQITPLQTSIPAGQASEQDLFDANSRLLLEKGKLISPEILEAIRKQEVYSVTYNWTTNMPLMPLAKDHHKSMNLIKCFYYEINLVLEDYLSKAKDILNQILIEMENGLYAFVNLSALETYDNFTYIHSINVALLAVVIGMHMGYAQEALHNLALGALLHDWGKLSVPSEILNKPSGLTLYEFDLIKQHPICGERMLLLGSKLPAEVVKAVRQHHERWDGQGYPDGLKGEGIHRNAQIVALADVFDALTEDRPYRRALPPYHALEMIFSGINKNFSPDVVYAFRSCLNIYPENSTVTLNTGKIGIVIAVSPELPTRPTVHIYKQHGNQVEEEIVDLRDDLALSIKAIDFDGPQMSKKMASQRISKILNGGFLKIKADIANDKGILNLSGVLDISAVEAFKSSVNCFEGINCLEINLGGITFVDSTGIGGIIEVVKKSREQSIFVQYKNIPKNIFELFTILGVPDLCGKEAFDWLPE